MTAFLDTNILVRHLTGDPPRQARRATRFLTEHDELLIAGLALAELVVVASFDRRIDKIESVQRLEP